MKKEIIDMTPTWSATVAIMIAALESGTPAGKRAAREELGRMARIMDQLVEQQKRAQAAHERSKRPFKPHEATALFLVKATSPQEAVATLLNTLCDTFQHLQTLCDESVHLNTFDLYSVGARHTQMEEGASEATVSATIGVDSDDPNCVKAMLDDFVNNNLSQSGITVLSVSVKPAIAVTT